MSRTVYLARQPILDRAERIVAYELLFRTGHDGAAMVVDDHAATVDVMMGAFTDLGIDKVLGRRPGYLNCGADLLLSDAVDLLPPEAVVLEVLESVDLAPPMVERLRSLRERGFRLALDDVTDFRPSYEAVLPAVDVVKIDVLAVSPERLPELVEQFRRWPVRLLAEKVETRDDVERCRRLGFELFQGYFFARPAVLSGRTADPSQLVLLRLLGEVLRESDLDVLEELLKHDPGLTHGLLRLVNSVAMGLDNRISSLRQAIVLLGRRRLQRWLELLLFVRNGGGPHPTPLLVTAAARGRLMESLGQRLTTDPKLSSLAFLVGVLSLLDALLQVTPEEVYDALNLDDDVRAALVERRGDLGVLLTLAEAIERDDRPVVDAILAARPDLDSTMVARCELEALDWALSVGEEISA